MALDIQGGLKNTAISSNKYVVLDELISNSIDSYLIRKKREGEIENLLIKLSTAITKSSLLGDSFDLEVSCTDNGAGFGDDEVKAFITKDTTYKDYLDIQGIGKCKGAGRIQFFHYFNHLKINSIYSENNVKKSKTLDIRNDAREINTQSFKTASPGTSQVANTEITLLNLTRIAQSRFGSQGINLSEDFSAIAIGNYLKTSFLQRFIVLKEIVGDFSIEITSTNEKEQQSFTFHSKDLPKNISSISIKLICTHRENQPLKSETVKLTRYSLPSHDYPNGKHEVALCANSAIVTSIVKSFLKNHHDRSKPIEGKFELILIEGDLLDGKVNTQRDGFNLLKECTANDSIEPEYSIEDIIDSIEDYVYEILTPKDFDRNILIKATEQRFGISASMLEKANIKVHYSDTEENIAKRTLKKFQEEIVRETSEIFDIKQKILTLDPRSDDYRDQVNQLSWKYTSTIKTMDMANLSQLVVRRASIIEILKQATSRNLNCQNKDDGSRKENEKIIHNIFFPTGADNSENIDHDIWILNEEYHYFTHISSDKALASLKITGGGNLFDSDIDTSLENLFNKNNADHKKKRPDIAIFNEEGSAIIIEFKAPGVELQDHIPDLIQYARLLAAKSNGKIKKFYGYLIGDALDASRMPGEFKKFPSGKGYFHTTRISDPETEKQYGELYSEVMFYDQFVDRAEKRLMVYKNKLNLNF